MPLFLWIRLAPTHEPDPKSGSKHHALQTLPRRFNLPETREAFGVRPACRRFRFMVPMRGCKTVAAFHEPGISTQGFKASRDCLPFIHERFESMGFPGRFMVTMRVRWLEVAAFHEPPRSGRHPATRTCCHPFLRVDCFDAFPAGLEAPTLRQAGCLPLRFRRSTRERWISKPPHLKAPARDSFRWDRRQAGRGPRVS